MNGNKNIDDEIREFAYIVMNNFQSILAKSEYLQQYEKGEEDEIVEQDLKNKFYDNKDVLSSAKELIKTFKSLKKKSMHDFTTGLDVQPEDLHYLRALMIDELIASIPPSEMIRFDDSEIPSDLPPVKSDRSNEILHVTFKGKHYTQQYTEDYESYIEDEVNEQQFFDRLQDPFRDFPFQIPISVASELEFDFDLGGKNNIKIATSPNEKKVVVTGNIYMKFFSEKAVKQIEQIVKDILGCSYVLDLSINYGILRLKDKPVTTKIEIIIAGVFPENIDLGIDPMLASMISNTEFVIPETKDEISKKRIESYPELAIDDKIKKLEKVISGTDDRGKELRNSIRLYFDAWSYTELDPGKSVAFALMSMESVLLENKTQDILARLKEAVAYRLGRSRDERRDLRDVIGKLYQARSSYVHRGEVEKPEDILNEALTLAKDVLYLEVRDYCTAPILSTQD